MFVYQAVIMLAVILIILSLIFVFKLKNRTILAATIMALVVLGGVALSLIQAYFGAHFYEQQCDVGLYKNLKVSDGQKSNLIKIFSDYKNTTSGENQYQLMLQKNYQYTSGKTNSVVTASIYLFSSKAEADEYFKFSQKIFDNKYYLPYDPKKTDKNAGSNPKYITSYIKSFYQDYNELLYIPSKKYYLSDIIIENDNIMIILNEKCNKAEIFKENVLKDINSRLRT